MTKREALNGKPYAGNPHIRFDEGEVVLVTLRRWFIVNKLLTLACLLLVVSVVMPMAGNEVVETLPIWQRKGLLPKLEWNCNTVDPNPAESSDCYLPPGLADEPMLDVRIAYRDGLPKISIDGVFVELILNMSDVNCKFGLNQAAKMDAMGITLNQIIFRTIAIPPMG